MTQIMSRWKKKYDQKIELSGLFLQRGSVRTFMHMKSTCVLFHSEQIRQIKVRSYFPKCPRKDVRLRSEKLIKFKFFLLKMAHTYFSFLFLRTFQEFIDLEDTLFQNQNYSIKTLEEVPIAVRSTDTTYIYRAAACNTTREI